MALKNSLGVGTMIFIFLAFAVPVDAVQPMITIHSPENITYNGTGAYYNITSNWSVNQYLIWAGYELNGASNVSVTPRHNITLYDYGIAKLQWDAACSDMTPDMNNFPNTYDSQPPHPGDQDTYWEQSEGGTCWAGGDCCNWDVAIWFAFNVSNNDTSITNLDLVYSKYWFYRDTTYTWSKAYCWNWSSNGEVELFALQAGAVIRNITKVLPLDCISNDFIVNITHHTGASPGDWASEVIRLYDVYLSSNATNFIDPTTIQAQDGSNILTIYGNNTAGELNSTTVDFYVNSTLLTDCTYLTNTKALTFHMFEEENKTAMNATMDITLWLRNPGDGFTDEYSFKFEDNDTYHICIYPSYEEYEVDATIEYYETGYTRRNYFFSNMTINNVTTDINLYLLDDTLTTDTKFTVKDVYHNLQDNVIIKTQRFYTDSNEYITIAMGRTGFDGIAGIPLKQNTWYKYVLERDYEVLRTFNPMYLTETELELYLTVEETVEFFEYYDSVAYNCNYNNNTQNLVCTVSDTSGKMVEAVLMVEERKPVGNWETVCLNSSTSSSTTLVCDLSGYQNKTLQYALRGRFCCSEETYFTMATGTLDLGPALLAFGMIGVLMAFFLITTMGFVGMWNPAVGILLMLLSLFISIQLGLIAGTSGIYTAFIALAVAGALIVFKLKV